MKKRIFKKMAILSALVLMLLPSLLTLANDGYVEPINDSVTLNDDSETLENEDPTVPDNGVPTVVDNSIAQGRWTITDPGAGGHNPAIGAGPDGLVVVGGDLSGIAVSEDHAQTWRHVPWTTHTHVSEIAFDPSDPAVFFVGTNGPLLRSTDRGQSMHIVAPSGANPPGANSGIYWTAIGVSACGDFVYAARSNSYGGNNHTPGTFFISRDGGDSFVHRNYQDIGFTIGTRLSKIVVHPTDPTIVFALSLIDGPMIWNSNPYSPGLYVSTNAGESFTQVRGTNDVLVDVDIVDIMIDPANSDVIYAVVLDNLVARPPPRNGWNFPIHGDSNWREHNGVYAVNWRTNETVAYARDVTGVISHVPGDGDYLLRVINVWGQVKYELTVRDARDIDGTDISDWFRIRYPYDHPFVVPHWGNVDITHAYPKTIVQSLADPNVYYKTDSQWIFVSKDGADSFVNAFSDFVSGDKNDPQNSFWRGRGFSNAVPQAVAVSPANPNVVFAGFADLGFWFSLDNGESWHVNNPVGDNGAWSSAWAGAGGGCLYIAPDPTRANVLWIAFGGETFDMQILKSYDYGRTFQFSSAGLPRFETMDGINWGGGHEAFGGAIRAIAVDPTSPENNRTLYATVGLRNLAAGWWSLANGGNAGTGEYQVFRSVDDGANWTKLPAPSGVEGVVGNVYYALAVDPQNGNIVYVGGASGLFRSENRGDSWTRIDGQNGNPLMSGNFHGRGDGDFNGVMTIEVSKTNPNIVWVASRTQGVFKSTDRGLTFAPVNVTGISTVNHIASVAIHPINPDIVFVTVSSIFRSGGTPMANQGVFLTLDGGLTWNQYNEGLAFATVRAISISPAAPNIVFIGAQGLAIQKRYFAYDGNDHILVEGVLAGEVKPIPVFVPVMFQSNVGNITVDGIFNFRRDAGFAHVPYGGSVTLNIDRSPTGVLYVNGIRTSFTGNTFTLENVTEYTAVRYLCRGYVSIVDNSIAQGRWTITDLGAGGHNPAMGQGPDGLMLAAGDLAGLYLSEDEGASWINIGMFSGLAACCCTSPGEAPGRDPQGYTQMDGQHVSAIAFDPYNPDKFFAGTHGALFRTVNRGETMEVVSQGLSFRNYWHAITIAPSNTNIVYAAASSDWNGIGGWLFISQDGGATFPTHRAFPENVRVQKLLVHPDNPDIIFALSQADQFTRTPDLVPGVFVTTDAGVTWTQIEGDDNVLINAEGFTAASGDARAVRPMDIMDIALDPYDPSILYVTANFGMLNAARTGWAYLTAARNPDISGLYAVDWANNEQLSFTSGLTGNISFVPATGDAAGPGRPTPKRAGLIRIINIWTSRTHELAMNTPGAIGGDWTSIVLFYDSPVDAFFTSSALSFVKTVTQSMINPQTYFKTDSQWIYKSTDAGASFVQTFSEFVGGIKENRAVVSNINTPHLGTWRGTGFSNAVPYNMAFSPTTPGVVYAGYADLGFKVSFDHGESWQPRNSIPINPETGANAPVSGNNWGARGGNVNFIAPDPTRDGVLWMASGGGRDTMFGVLYSENHGETWKNLSAPVGGINRGGAASHTHGRITSIAIDPTSPEDNRTLYMTMNRGGWNLWGNAGLFRSTDHGRTWTRIHVAPELSLSCECGVYNCPGPRGPGHNAPDMRNDLGDAYIVKLHPHNSDIIFVGYDAGLYRSLDRGETWAHIPTVGGSFTNQSSIAISPSNPNVIYVTTNSNRERGIEPQSTRTTGGGVYKSIDGGATFTQIVEDQYGISIAVHPTNPDIVFYSASGAHLSGSGANNGTLSLSLDGGTTWTEHLEGLEWPTVRAIHINPFVPNAVFIGAQGNSYQKRWFAYDGTDHIVKEGVMAGETEAPTTWFRVMSRADIGSISPSGIRHLPEGESITFTINPVPYGRLYVNNILTPMEGNTFTLENISEDTTIFYVIAHPRVEDFTLTFHLYSANQTILDTFAGYATDEIDGRPVIVVPVVPGTAKATWAGLEDALAIGNIYGTSAGHGYALWGWFDGETLDDSGRIREGLRRPEPAAKSQLASLLEQIENITAADALALFEDGNIDMFGLWVRWGDLDDNGIVNMADLNLLQRQVNFGHMMDVVFNELAADVVVDGVINSFDLNLLQRSINLGHIVPVVLGIKPQ